MTTRVVRFTVAGALVGALTGGVLVGVAAPASAADLPGTVTMPHGQTVLGRAVSAILAWSCHPDRLNLWRQRAHTLGKYVRIGAIEGVATGLRDDGALLVEGAPVLAGEISPPPG